MKTVKVVAAVIKSTESRRRANYICNTARIWRIQRRLGISGR